MFFKLGALFLLGSLSVSSALRPCVCTRNLKPVCGADGQTYGNKCTLECAGVALAYQGQCSDSESVTIPIPLRKARQAELNCFCTYEYNPFCGTDGRTYSNRCEMECAQRSAPVEIAHQGECENNRDKRQADLVPIPLRYIRQAELNCFCTYEYNPFCGTDGRTYSNRCEMECAQRSAPVEIAHQGECENNRDKRQTDLLPIPLRKARQAELNCFCTYEYYPFCGTDGRTYSNRCEMECAQRSAPVEIAHQGECENNRDKRETVNVADLPSKCSCPKNFAPVCGSDGTTYDNNCVLDCLSQHRPELRLQHVGACGIKSCSCSREAIPVCGTDGITYDNLCQLECSKQTNKDLDVLHEGECDTGVKVVDASCTCTREGRPVCGTDGNTYNNPCLLNCARANDESLSIDYEGPCDNRVKVVDQAENFPCTCTRNLKPVCASNGVTFPNKCLMKCAGTHLTVAKEAPCEDSY